MNLRWLLFSFKGRINRQPFWAFTLCAGLLWLILSLLLGIDLMHRSKDVKSFIPTLILLWPSLAVQAKRWHDRDKSAWWILISIIPVVGPIWAFIENGCLAGTEGENRFGDDPLGRSSKDSAAEKIQSPQKVISGAGWKPGNYHLSSLMKVMLLGSCILMMFTTFSFYLIDRDTAIEFPGGVIPFVVMNIAYIAVIIWRVTTPVVEVSETEIKLGIPFIFKTNTARWEDIDAMVIGETNNLGVKDRNVKLLLKSAKGTGKELFFSLKAVENPDELIESLRAKIPEKGFEEIRQSTALRKPFTKSEVKYRGWTLNETGLSKGKEEIHWSNIREIKYAGLVLAGYGATTIVYVRNGAQKRSLTVQPSIKEEYLDFIRYLVTHAQKASIDPGLVEALEYPPTAAKADMIAVALFITGMILFFISPIFIFYYSDGISRGYLNAALWLPTALIPMVMTIKGLSERFRGTSDSSSNKILWACLYNIGQISAVLVFLALSPPSFNWLAGDISVKTGNLDKAEHFYQAALDITPENIDVLYEMGKLNLEKKNYEKAFDYLKRAYTKDPTYWGPKAVELIPDTLVKIGRYDEALVWCERILKDRPGKKDIAWAINKKRDEIRSQKELSKQNQNQI